MNGLATEHSKDKQGHLPTTCDLPFSSFLEYSIPHNSRGGPPDDYVHGAVYRSHTLFAKSVEPA
jgi:hypothetical protein